MPEKIVIADTSCLISLINIGAIALLKEMYQKIYITKEVSLEYGEHLPAWIKIREVKKKIIKHGLIKP